MPVVLHLGDDALSVLNLRIHFKSRRQK